MNKSMIRYLLSKLLLIEAVLLLVPVAIAVYYRESSQVFTALFSTIGILVLLGGSGSLQKPKNQRIYAKEGVLIVALCWILWSFFGGLPFVFSGQIPSLIDAFFEISSGFTTTGASILNDISVLSRSLLFWRSFTHLIGGMGVLVFALAIMDNAKNSHLEVMKAEVPGPVFGKVVSKLKNTAQILYLLYIALFSLFVIYAMILLALIFIVSLDSNDFLVVTSAVFSCFNNIGPILGTTSSFSIFSPISKILLSFAMIAGRLEIYPILLLFMKRTWSKR
ncbi:potassium transporter TrkG [Streptococcus pneumoniae]|uniref:potassium transporter TrkG n=1 Tax=Streptococcus pneumoniae TaxID=1313 RepID=UPI0005E386F1|nr:potassium transporter TrkG [Streptococcus pneumoniae]CGF02889.1 potassium uptake protein [Streptococcus pneumoniae]CGF33130.1 potassium uptake protein [Streptococcus pneumoniae]CIT02251.1 potassium uptake protein [Streptococcus pneumoniae]CJP56528.1 potassium uptake protein [Streptococcus pneumoniae]